MKQCTKCKETKDESEFNKKKGRKDGLSSHCKTCSRKLTNESYAKKPDYYRANILKRRRRIKKILDKIKTESPCCDCKNNYPPYVMDFDHLDSSKKEFGISNAWNLSFDRLMEEVKKCEVVCSNCHRIRTHKRQKILTDV